jgi:hypothetical protein
MEKQVEVLQPKDLQIPVLLRQKEKRGFDKTPLTSPVYR